MMAFRVVRGSDVLYLDTPLEPQLHKPNRWWVPRGVIGVSPDTRRTLTVNNFQTPGAASSLCRASQYKPGLLFRGPESSFCGFGPFRKVAKRRWRTGGARGLSALTSASGFRELNAALAEPGRVRIACRGAICQRRSEDGVILAV